MNDDEKGIKVLYDKPVQSPEFDKNSVIDACSVVAINGLGAHSEDTWCKKVTTDGDCRYVNWLEAPEMLQAVIPNTRIMRYGYQSIWYGTEAIKQRASTVALRLLSTLDDHRTVSRR